jgi:CelD/BcsL family acetyltransferase involved in cellulose biosynthesis
MPPRRARTRDRAPGLAHRLTTTTVASPSAEVQDAWDRMAVAQGRPRSAPAAVLAWYRYVLRDLDRARVVVVRDGKDVVGVLPLYVDRDAWGCEIVRMAGHQVLVGVEPLADPRVSDEVADAFAQALAGLTPTPSVIEIECAAGAGDLLGRVAARRGSWWPRVAVVPSVAPEFHLDQGRYEEWLERRHRTSGKQSRRHARRLEELGYRPVVATTAPAIRERIPELRRLYDERKEGRGGWGIGFGGRTATMLGAVADELAPAGRVVLCTWERDGVALAADLALTAGATTTAWIGAVGSVEPRYSPGHQSLLLLLEHAHASGASVLDLGPGVESYKERYANGERRVEAATLDRLMPLPARSPRALVTPALRRTGRRWVAGVRG